MQDKPALFSTFLMWLLADLHHDLPEVGDLDKPKLVFFFDEAHLLFRDASKDFLDQIAQTVRLIRSKGVGVFFVTQVPTDVPPEVLAQLGNRVQHALRVFTPADAKSLSSTVSTFPRSKAYDLAELLPSLGIGEAVVTVLSETGAPTPVAWTRLRPPTSLMAQLDAAEQTRLVQPHRSPTKYGGGRRPGIGLREAAGEGGTAGAGAAHPRRTIHRHPPASRRGIPGKIPTRISATRSPRCSARVPSRPSLALSGARSDGRSLARSSERHVAGGASRPSARRRARVRDSYQTPLGVTANGDRAVQIRPKAAYTVVLQASHRVRARMPVWVVATDDMRRDLGSHGRHESRVLPVRAVMRHLEHVCMELGRLLEQILLALGFDVSGHQQRHRGSPDRQDERVVVGVAVRAVQDHSRREHGPRDVPDRLPRTDRCHPDRYMRGDDALSAHCRFAGGSASGPTSTSRTGSRPSTAVSPST